MPITILPQPRDNATPAHEDRQELRIGAINRHSEAGKSLLRMELGFLGRFAGWMKVRKVAARDRGADQQLRERKGGRRPHGPEDPFQIVRACGAGESGARIRGGNFGTDTRNWRATSMPVRW